jgi:hypothetical protein
MLTERSGVCMDLCIILVFQTDLDVSDEYGIAQKPVNWLVNCTLKYITIFFFLFIEFTSIVRNEALQVQCTTHDAVIPF